MGDFVWEEGRGKRFCVRLDNIDRWKTTVLCETTCRQIRHVRCHVSDVKCPMRQRQKDCRRWSEREGRERHTTAQVRIGNCERESTQQRAKERERARRSERGREGEEGRG